MIARMSWVAREAGTESDLDGVFGLLPPAYARFRAMYGALWNPPVVDPVLLELCRLHIAAVLGCEAESRIRFRAAIDAGLTEEKVRALPRYTSAPELSATERACIGFAEQYVLDYSRTFGLRTAVFRMSCIYGPHQFGNEDQGWVAHFAISTLRGEPITLYGDGRQVRDILYVEDLVDAFLHAQARMPSITGEAFNIGGGATNTVSLLELADLLAEVHGERPTLP